MKKIVLAFASMIAMEHMYAQNTNDLITGVSTDAINDANTYLTQFLKPFGEGQIFNLNTGWYNTAKTHKKLGFDISVSLHAAFVPKERETFEFKNSDYKNLQLKTGSSAMLPTFLGGNTDAQLTVTSNSANNYKVTPTFTAPKGVAASIKDKIPNLQLAVPLPVAQIGIGLIKKTDIKLRYFPKTNIGDVNLGVFGLGVQHDIGQYIPVFKHLPLVHLSALAGYNSLTAEYKPGDIKDNGYLSTNGTAMNFSVNTFTVQTVASVKLLLLELYAGAGYYSGKSSMNLNGEYTFTYTDNSKRTITNPLSLNYSVSGFSATTGAKLNLAFFKAYADYTFAQYKTLNIGFAFSFR